MSEGSEDRREERGEEPREALEWRPVGRARAYEQVLARIEERIGAGALGVGDRLPAERDLAARLGVSRAAVREALRVLEALGVVRAGVGAGPDGGTVLASMPSEALTQLLRLHIALANFPMPDVIEARVMFERWSARLAAQYASEEDRARLSAIVAEMDRPDIAREDFNTLDTEFHVAIAEAGRNRLVADLTSAIRSSMHASILQSFYDNPLWDDVQEELRVGHRGVLDAICRSKGVLAADRIEAHIRYAYASLSWSRPSPRAASG